MTIGAIVFDFDGVILESADLKTVAFLELFAHLPEGQREELRRYHLDNLGISRYVKFAWIYETLLQRPLSDEESAELGRRFSELVFDRVCRAPFVAGAREALEALAPRYPLFVASGTPHEELERVVEARGLRPFFREVWGAPREKALILRDVATRCELAPEAVLMIGDGSSDYRAARRAGASFLARDTPEHHDLWEREGVRLEPDLVRLPDLVGAWR